MSEACFQRGRTGGSTAARRCGLFGGVVLAALMAAGVGALLQEPRPQLQRLPDGSRIWLGAAGYGTAHPLRLGPRWRQLLAPLLPAPGPGPGRLRRASSAEVTTPADRLLFWTVQNPGPWTSLEPTVFDEAGNESRAVRHWNGFLTPEGRWASSWLVAAFPRRGRVIGLRLTGRVHGAAGTVEFRVPNPDPGPHPAWIPAPLPGTQPSGELSVTLASLTRGVPTGVPRLTGSASAWTTASFTVSRAGSPAPEWAPVAVEVADAAGNRWRPQTTRLQPAGRVRRIAIMEPLWRGERAWKLRFEFSRGSGFAPEELWQPAPLPVPAKYRISTPALSVSRFGTRVTLQRLDGPSANLDVARAGLDYELPSLWWRVDRPPDGARVALLEARSDGGLPATGLKTADLGRPGLVSSLPVRGGRTVTLRFAIHPSRFVEFTASPRP